MFLKQNNGSWWDGWVYAAIFDPFEKEIRSIVSDYIENESSVIDLGCGTGALALELSSKCRRVVGIDASPQMIRYANKKKGIITNVEFLNKSILELSASPSEKYAYAVISMVFHELSAEIRNTIIKKMKGIADKMIIADYIAPQPDSLWGVLNSTAEMFEGISVYKNYRSFLDRNGIDQLLYANGLTIEREQIAANKTLRVVMVS